VEDANIANPPSERVIKHANHPPLVVNYLTKSRSVASTKADFLNLDMSTCAISAENHANYSNPGPIKGGSKASQPSNYHAPNPALILNPSRSSFSGVLNLGANYVGHRSNYKNYIANQIANHASNQADLPNPALNGGHNHMKPNHGTNAAINSTAAACSTNSSSKWDDAERWINNPSPNSRSLVEPNYHAVSNYIANPNPNHASQGPIKKANPTNHPQPIRASKNTALPTSIRKANQAIISDESVTNHVLAPVAADQQYAMPKIHGNGS
jgi:hypothetical protein